MPSTPVDEAPTGHGGDQHPRRRRDAARTRQSLLQAARRRFLRDGYERATLRDVAADAGVNLALVKRYFGSKAGLFEAALTSVPSLMPESGHCPLDAPALAEMLCRQLAAESWAAYGDHPILLFLRDSGDEHTDALRRAAVQGFSERLLQAVGIPTDGPDAEAMLLRAQLVVALASGITVLRSTVGLRPLNDVTAEDLIRPLTDAIDALLAPQRTPTAE